MSALPSGLPEHVNDGEGIARFLTSSSHFAATKNLVKPGAFLPNPRNLETSVFREIAEPHANLWHVVSDQLPEERKVHGAALVEVIEIRKAELDVVSDEDPPNGPRHANIVGWPRNEQDPRQEKEMWKDRANLIASKANLILRDTGI